MSISGLDIWMIIGGSGFVFFMLGIAAGIYINGWDDAPRW